MSQNTSSAVMQQRAEPHDSLDDFPTQPWATRALIEHVIRPRLGHLPVGRVENLIAWEPTCNRGHMAKPLSESFARVIATDVQDYGFAGQTRSCDFLFTQAARDLNELPRWAIFNPPFRLAERFILHALSQPEIWGVAAFVRIAFLEGEGRFRRLYERRPPTIVAQFSERVVLTKGRLLDQDKKYLDPATGKLKKPSTATAYCWMVWAGFDPQPPLWIPPCRRQLVRPGDYPDDVGVAS